MLCAYILQYIFVSVELVFYLSPRNLIVSVSESGTECWTTILHAPVDTKDLVTGDIFTHAAKSNAALQDHLLEFSLQTPKTSNIQGTDDIFNASL